MGDIKERDYMFDTFRGLLILTIPMSHFTKMVGNQYGSLYMDGGFPENTLFGFVYITINLFVMQAFMFLSGYFSKNVDRAQETAFSTFMKPYLVFTLIYYFVRLFFYGDASLKFLTPPFALWFLFVLFFYRFFLKYMVKFPNLMFFSLVLYLIAGQVEEFGDFLALGRALSYFPFFLLGYYCTKERLDWFRQLKTKPILLAVLGVLLVGISIIFMYSGCGVSWLLLKQSYHSFDMYWWQDILLRIAVLFIASGWIIFMVNIIPSNKNFISFIGINTMPVYMFHLTLRYIFRGAGVYVGFIFCVIVAWFGVLSILYIRNKDKLKGSNILYITSIILSLVVLGVVYGVGLLNPLFDLCPSNIVLVYLMTYGGALICGISFVAPFWTKLYDLLINGPECGSKFTNWLQKKGED